MDRAELFLNTRIEGQGAFSEIGNFCLTPYRYLFGGRNIQIIPIGANQGVHHVASFHYLGNRNQCSTNPTLFSGEMNLFYTALAIALLIPGIILGSLFKGIDYIFDDVNVENAYQRVMTDMVSNPIKEAIDGRGIVDHSIGMAKDLLAGRPVSSNTDDIRRGTTFDPDWEWKSRILQIKTVGSRQEPIQNQTALDGAVKQLSPSPTDILVIFGDGNLQIDHDPGIAPLNPMKVILIGAKVLQNNTAQGHRLNDTPVPTLHSVLNQSGKWQQTTAASIKDAMKERVAYREYLPCKQYHVLYEVSSPQKKQSQPLGPSQSSQKPRGKKRGSNIHTIHDQ